MKTKMIFLTLLLVTGLSTIAQTVFRGVVVDAKSKQPITNAKIGITNQGVGVVSNASGAYIYKKYHETLSDTDRLIISAPGYETIELEAKEVRTLLNRNSTTQLEKSLKTNVVGIIKNVKIFWDLSEGMQDRDLEQELATVQKYLDSLGDMSVTLDVFNNKVIATEKWKKWDGDMSRFRESVTQTTYDGPSNYSILDFEEADAVILASNGEPNYGELAVQQDIPVFALSSNFTEDGKLYFQKLGSYTSGNILQKSNSTREIRRDSRTNSKEQGDLYTATTSNTISGKITSLGSPIQGATIMIKGDLAEYKTQADGTFTIPASEGDVLLVRALGMFPKGVAIVNNSQQVSIEMLPSIDQLDEVVISGKEKIMVGNKIVEGTNEPNMPGGVTRLGDFYITNKDITPNGKSVAEVLREKFKGVWISYGPEGEIVTIFGENPLWYVNGFKIGPGEPIPLYIPDTNILSIIVKEGLGNNIKYGGDGEKGLQVLITTKNFREDFKEPSLLATNNDYIETVPSIDVSKNTITGTVLGPQGPIQGAEVLRKGSFELATTASDGSFKLNAKEGDILLITALGTFSKTVAVTDQKEYAINVLANKDYLDEVVITGETRKLPKTKAQEVYGYGPDLETGSYKLKGFGTANVTIITNDDFKFETQPDMAQALFGRFESVFVVRNPTSNLYGRPYILRGAFEEPIELFIDGQQELGSVFQVNPSEVVSISIKSDKTGIFPPALLIDTNRSGIVQNPESLLAKDNDYEEEVADISNATSTITGTVLGPQGPIQGAEVLRKGSFEMATTAFDGSFKLNAKEGDILLITALGTFSKTVAVTDQKEFTINVLANKDYLDEVVITGETRKLPKIKAQEVYGYGPDLETGRYKLKGFGSFNVTTITKDDFKFEIAPDMEKALSGRFESLFISPEDGRPFILRGAFEEPIELFIDGQRELGPVFQVNPLEVVSISIKSDKTGVFPPALLIDTNRSRIVRNPESLLAKNNDYEEEIAEISNATSTITGTVLGPEGPIQDAEVLRKGSFEIANTDSRGNFKLNIKDGDVLIVSALGMFTKEILSDSKDFYTINLLPEGDVLNEVEITGDGTQDRSIETYYGKKNPDAIGYDVKTLTSDDIKDNYYSIVDLLNGRFANVKATQSASGFNVFGGRAIGLTEVPMLIDIDGQIFSPNDVNEPGAPPRGAPVIDPSRIESISIIKGLSGVTRYGRGAEGGAVIIKTKGLSGNASAIASRPSALVTGNDYNEEVKEIATVSKIRGIITGPNGPINDASITKKGTFNEVSSSTTGGFIIYASLGDILVISASKMFPKEILIENQDLGTIKLTPKTSDLEAVVLGGQKRVDNTVVTADGKINKDKLGYTVETLDEKDFSSGYTTLQQLITGKVAGVEVAGGLYSGSEVIYKIRGGTQSITTEKPPIWIVNGTPYEDVPNFLDVQQIKSISVLKSVMATSRYGSLAAGGAFLIKTKEADFKYKVAASNRSALVSGNEYTGDVTGNIDAALPAYIIRFRESGTPQQQLALYKKLSRTQESPLEYYVDAAQYFESLDPKLGDEVRSDLAYIARNNTKALRTLAYLYEQVNDHKNVVLVNERIVKIAPQEAQSYRDLALAYQNDKQYDKALELYINMIGEQVLGVNFDGLENPLRSELSRLVALYKDKIDYSRLPNEWLRADFKRDMRMVIDWSDRSVPFEFQFVNPDKKFYKWTHTLEETRDRLEMEQKQGFQTEEFIIDDAPAGEWIINIQYLGDEGDYALPPFLKYTMYRNYGTPQETKEIRVIKLFKQVDKVTLGRLTM